MAQEEIVNKVAASGIVMLDFEVLYPEGLRMSFDIRHALTDGVILREKDFREFVKNKNWAEYSGAQVAVFCTADVIIPHWALMVIASALSPFAAGSYYCPAEQLEDFIFARLVQTLPIESYIGQRVVIKGCSKKNIPASAYLSAAERLTPVVKSLMFGEPCSTVPVYKKKS
jgi:hypothetical protein